MSNIGEISEKAAAERIANEMDVAVVFVDGERREILTANNNSICRNLNPDGKLTGHCATFCGTAFEETTEVGGPVSYTCHAGLECRAIPFHKPNGDLVAIVGRTFLNSENYRRATERAMSGDWSGFAPSEFFENILMTGSKDLLDSAARQIEAIAGTAVNVPAVETELEAKPIAAPPLDAAVRPAKKPDPETTSIVEKFNREIRGKEPIELIRSEAKSEAEPEHPPVREPKIEKPSVALEPILVDEPESASQADAKPEQTERRMAESRAWRSFFGSLLKMGYPDAIDSILEFLGRHYGFSALIWLERVGASFDNTAAFGETKNRKVRIGVAPDDPRLIAVSQREMPLELGERPKEGLPDAHRMMHLFPIGVGGEISAAIAIIDPIKSETDKKQIARICHSVAPQLEILRLRTDVARRELLGRAVRQFSDSIKTIDDEDFWFKLTQNAAEMLQAERASLLVFDERAEKLGIKSLIGSRTKFDPATVVGSRVAKIVFARNEPVVVADVAKTGLPPAPETRHYKMPSFLSCPINIGGRTIGVMNFTDRAGGRPFDKASLELFQAIAPQLAVAIDRAALKEKAGEFEHLSVTDALTGLLNRRYIEERLMEEIKRSNRHGFPMSFMMLDVDNFKSYNDQFGHPAGDEALKTVGHVVRETLRGADVAARYGGEEFAILLPQTNAYEAATIAERIRQNVEQTDFPHRRVTLSIGVASCSTELCSAPHLISAADKALYEAKRLGRNRVRTFEEMNGVGAEPITA